MIHPERDDWARQLTALRQQMAEQAASLDASGEFPWRNIDHLRAGGWFGSRHLQRLEISFKIER
ncbi:hypothetical protein ACQSAS_27585, partial [Klebsiella pneumoniae]